MDDDGGACNNGRGITLIPCYDSWNKQFNRRQGLAFPLYR